MQTLTEALKKLSYSRDYLSFVLSRPRSTCPLRPPPPQKKSISHLSFPLPISFVTFFFSGDGAPDLSTAGRHMALGAGPHPRRKARQFVIYSVGHSWTDTIDDRRTCALRHPLALTTSTAPHPSSLKCRLPRRLRLFPRLMRSRLRESRTLGLSRALFFDLALRKAGLGSP